MYNLVVDKWAEILNFFKNEFDIADVSFNSWIKPLQVYSVENNVVTLLFKENDAMIDKNDQEYLLTPREAIEKMLYRNEISHNAWGKLYHRELFEQKSTLNFNEIFEDERYKQFNPIQKEQYRFPVGIINEDLALIYYLTLECPQIVQGTRKTYYYFLD